MDVHAAFVSNGGPLLALLLQRFVRYDMVTTAHVLLNQNGTEGRNCGIKTPLTRWRPKRDLWSSILTGR